MAKKAPKSGKRGWPAIESELDGIPVATTDFFPGGEIESYKGYVWATSVQSKFIGHDMLAAAKSMVGGEVWPYTKMINEAKHIVVHKLVKNARVLGADAIVGVRMGSAQVTPGTIEVHAYGTAVKLKKKK